MFRKREFPNRAGKDAKSLERIVVAALLAALLLALPTHADTPVTARGHVVTRGLVLDANNQPILAEYDTAGEFISVLPSGVQATVQQHGFENIRIISGSAYRLLLDTFDAYRAEHDDDIARGAIVWSAKDYADAADLGSVNVPQADGSYLPTPLPKPRALSAHTKSVLVRSTAHLSGIAGLGSADILLFEAPINLQPAVRDNAITADTGSVLIGANGEVLHKTANRISYRTAFYVPEDNPTEPEDEDSTRPEGDSIALGPVQGAHVDVLFSLNNVSTNPDGSFETMALVPPCMFLDHLPVTVAVPYKRFNPLFKDGIGYHYVGGRVPLVCVPTPIFGVIGGYTDYVYTSPAAIPVDLVGVTGHGIVSNDDTALPSGPTEYDSTTATHEHIAPQLDLDGNGHDNWVGAPDGTQGHPGDIYPDGHERAGQVMVVLGGNPVCFEDSKPYLNCATGDNGLPLQNPMPHLYRSADPLPDTQHRGLLTQLSDDDLQDTTFYVYRASTGELVAETHGIRDNRLYKQGEAKLAIDLTIPGPHAYRGFGLGLDYYQEQHGITGAFAGKQNKDTLKPGDLVQIIAINRKSGYLGVATAPIGQNSQSTGNLNGVQNGMLVIDLGTLYLAPPNLNVEATRIRNDDETFQIGFEGAGLTQDTLIQITTQWLGPNNEPLPTDLPGYTGRLAKVIAQNTLSETQDSSGVAFFPISPGRQQQVLKFKGDILTTEHFYVHINAQPEGELADFSTGDHSGSLQYRPNTYVPFKVAIPDVPATRQAQKTDSDAPGIYRWVYRPEMQFSVFDLAELTLQQGEGDTEQNLLDLDGPIALNLDEAAQLLYQILAGNFDPLPLLGPNRDLLLALGHSEYLLCLSQTSGNSGGEGNDCGEINLTPEEIEAILTSGDGALALALYLNTDPANRLYDFAHFDVAIGVDMNRDGKISYAPGDRTSISQPFVFWVNDDYDVVSLKGQPKLDEGGQPVYRCKDGNNYDFTMEDGRQVCEEDDLESGSNTGIYDGGANERIESYRDLEDFAGLELRIPENTLKHIKEQGGSIVLSSTADVRINLFKGKWADELNYMKNETVAKEQVQEPRWKGLGISFPLDVEDFDEDGRLKLIFDVRQPTADNSEPSHIQLEVKDLKNEVIGDDTLYVEFRSIEKLYEHWTVGTGHGRESPIADTATLVSGSLNYNIDHGLERPDFNDQYIMLVHGWRMKDFERRRFAETAMKRLYWEGYKGRFGLFSWPTGWFEKPPYATPEQEGDAAALDPQNYDRSEAKARRTGSRLYALLHELRTRQSSLHITAHSMGNVVVSEALRHAVFNDAESQLVDSYIAMQSAEAAQAFAPDAPDMNVSLPGEVLAKLDTWTDVQFDNPDQPFETAWQALNKVCTTFNGSLVCPGYESFDIPPNQYQQSILSPRSMEDSTWVRGGSQTPTHYYRHINQKSGRILSFYNTQDYALNGWEFNQATKPDSGTRWLDDFDYIPDPSDFVDQTAWKYNHSDAQSEPVRKVTDEYSVDPFGLFGDDAEYDIVWTNGIDVNGNGRPEILAHIIPARSFALGAASQLCANGVLECASSQLANSSLVNTGEGTIFEFTEFSYDHSAQFLNSHVERGRFWRELLVASGVIPPEDL
jgi:hypothetical protein